MFTLDFDDMFDAYNAAIQKKWAHNRSLTVGASECFKCIRALACDKRNEEWGIKPDEDFEEDWGATSRGNLIENYHVVPALNYALPEEITLEYAGDDQQTVVLGRNSCTPDGLFTNIPVGPVKIKAGGNVIHIPMVRTGCIGLEIKSIDPRATLEEEKRVHYGQTQIGLGILNETTEWKPEHWIILYFDASFLSKMTPFLIEYEPNVFKSAKMIANAVYTRESITDFEPEGKITGECDRCKWKDACGEAVLSQYYGQTDDDVTPDPVIIAAFEPLAEEYRTAKDAAKEAAENLARIEQTVKDALLEHKRRKVSGTTWGFTWFTKKGASRISYKRACEDHELDLTAYKDQGPETEQLRFTPKSGVVKEKKPRKKKVKDSNE